jgi:peroxiredoxin
VIPDTGRTIGMAYGAARSPRDEYAQRIAFLIDEQGRIEQAHARVNPKEYPAMQLAYLVEREEQPR